MKTLARRLFIPFLLGSCAVAPASREVAAINTVALQDGDILMIRSYSYNANAIDAVTGSRFTHCGIVFREGDHWKVYEGAGRKGHLDLAEWVAYESAGHEPHWKVFRLKDRTALGSEAAVQKLKKAAGRLHDTPYDHAFSWDYPPGDEEYVYCSELIWKAYQQALGIQLCAPRRLGSYVLNEEAMRILNSGFCKASRGGGSYSPDEMVVAPGEVAGSPLLREVEG